MAPQDGIYTRGILAIFVAAVLFGIAGAAAKVLFETNVSPLDLTALRTFIACAAMGLILLVLPGPHFRVPRAEWPMVIFVGILFVLVNATFYIAIDLMTVAAAITLEYTSPFFVLMFGVFSGRRRLTPTNIAIVTISLVGCFLLTGSESNWIRLSLGLGVGLTCGLSFAIFNMACNHCKERGIGATTLTFWSFAVSAVIWLIALPWLTIPHIDPSAETVAYIGFISIIATVLPYWLLVYGLRHVDAFPATVVGLFDPFAAGVFAYLLLGETLTAPNIIGMVLVLAAVLMVHRTRENGMTKSVESVEQA